MKLRFQEYKRIFFGALVLDGFYLLAALIFSFLSLKALGGLLLGTGCAVANSILLEWSTESLTQKEQRPGVRFYFGGYMGRLALSGICLFIGFQWLDPFAAAVPLLAPNVTYLFSTLNKGKT